jgi:hypothetical protein
MRIRLVIGAVLACALMLSVSVSLAAEGTPGYIKTSVNPGRAGVFIDGKYVGPAANFKVARKYPVSPGEHEVKLVEPRYEEITTKVTVQSGKTTKVSQTMKALPPPKPPFGRVRTISDDKFAAVYANDKYMGHADEFSNSSQGLLLPPGEYTIKIVPASGGAGTEEKVNVQANQIVVVGGKKK